MSFQTSINFDNPAKFLVSFGTILLFSGFGIYIYQLRFPSSTYNDILLLVLSMLFMIGGFFLFGFGFKKWIYFYNYEVKMMKERIVSEIIKQDNNFMNLKLKEVEYNLKIDEFNEKHPSTTLGHRASRDFPNIVEQALDVNHYENHFDNILSKIEKKNKEKRRM
ncbi:MAG: hypothetical protein WC852_03110 [Candidatus Nanoarchaeia archaeon]|jgi:hypothetical protein